MSAPNNEDITPKLQSLSISSASSNPPPKPPQKSQPTIADSWEDEASSDSDTSPPSKQHTIPNAPPPTPLSTNTPIFEPFSPSEEHPSPRERNKDIRPEKTTAVANRLIAGALGVRAPKKTEEQRKYDSAVREKEEKRRMRERQARKEAEEEARSAKAAIWED